MVTAGVGGTVKVWDAKTFQEQKQFQAQDVLGGLVVSPMADRVVTTFEKYTGASGWEIWDLADAKPRRPPLDYLRRPFSISPDGSLLAIEGRTKSVPQKPCVKLWDLRDGKVVSEFEVKVQPKEAFIPSFMVFSPDGAKLAVGHGGRTILLFTLPAAKKVGEKPPAKK